MQFSKVRMNQRYGLLPSNLCPIKQDDSDPKYYKKTSVKVKFGMKCKRMITNLFTLQPNKAKKFSMLPVTLHIPIKTLLINK